ncbi:MAG: type II 3-dehydroquinate dehydratase [Hyphomonadaceae bacterium]|nr:type II 3-dehydroquinate dehydratase [Hyphomonadaceae bacterium]
MPNTIHVLNGPNLNLLGEREPHIYGRDTLADVEKACRAVAARHGLELVFRQTNAEHQMIDWLHQTRKGGAVGVAINPAAFCYNSVPVLDALKMCDCPVVEVHISNIHNREAEWRAHTITAVAATGMISGLGAMGYSLAVEWLAQKFNASMAKG